MILLWLRRDLRLADNPALHAAAAAGRAVIPVVLRDEAVEAMGAAPRMRWGMAVAAFAPGLAPLGSRLTLRTGPAAATLAALAAETGATEVWLTRLPDPLCRAQEAAVAALPGVALRAFDGFTLAPPEALATGQGTPFRVFAPFRRALWARDWGTPLPAPARLPGPGSWPASERLEDWRLDAAMGRGGPVVAAHQSPGEARARARLEAFLDAPLDRYATDRDDLAADGSSRLSENLAQGEVGPRTCWAAALSALDRGSPGAEAFLRELAWREFSQHMLHHRPTLAEEPLNPAWARFPWDEDEGSPLLRAWRSARTGLPLVDAGLREMWVTGRMHNRMRMLTASVLVKTFLTDWRLGLRWFADQLADWDPAANALNWQWVAGTGPDSAPFFRVFSPDAQAARHDASGAYRRRWLAEGQARPPATALAFFDAVPRSWGLAPRDPYPVPILDPAEGRRRALAAFDAFRRR
jgi:deoxyribodipyrimidine photo-lyase